MKKFVLLSALLIGSVGISYAQDAEEAARNAVCVTLVSGDAEFVAFTNQPAITTSDGNLIVINQESAQTVLTKPLSEVENISAVSHDFTTGINRVSDETGREVEAIYDMAGRKVSWLKPGEVYILKFTDGSTKKTIK